MMQMMQSCNNFVLLLGLLAACSGLGGCVSVAPPAPEVMGELEEPVPPPRGPLTVDEAVERGLAHDPDLRAARHRVSAAAWQKVQVALPANPQLGVMLDPVEWVVQLSARITDLLDLGGQRRAETRAAQSRQEQAALEAMRRRIELVRLVRSDFSEAWAHREMAQIRRRRVAVLEDLVAVARAQRDLGELATIDVLRFEQRLLEAQMETSDQNSLQRQSAARLHSRLGLPLSAEIELTRPAGVLGQLARQSHAQVNAQMSADIDSAVVELGFLRRPELALVTARAQEHHALLRAARVTWLDVEAGPYLKRGGGPTVGGGRAALVLPIVDRGQARRGVQASLLAALEQDMLAVQAELLLEVHTAWWALRRAEQRFLVDLPAMRDQVAARHALFQQAADLGASSAVEVQLALLEIFDADLMLAGAHLSWLQAQAALAAAIGDSGDSSHTGNTGDGILPADAQQGRGHDGQA